MDRPQRSSANLCLQEFVTKRTFRKCVVLGTNFFGDIADKIFVHLEQNLCIEKMYGNEVKKKIGSAKSANFFRVHLSYNVGTCTSLVFDNDGHWSDVGWASTVYLKNVNCTAAMR